MPSAILETAKHDDARRVPLNDIDKKNGTYSAPALQMALEGLHQDGMVILKGIVDTHHCDALHKHMSSDRDRILRERHAGAKAYNQGVKCQSIPSIEEPKLCD